jgi:hypothetical protein
MAVMAFEGLPRFTGHPLVTKDYLELNLIYWMQGMTIACVVIPLIRSFLG